MNVTNDGAAPAPRRSGRIGDGASFLLETLRARPAARRVLSGVSVLLAVFAVGLLAYPMYTNLYQDRLQSKLAIEFKKAETKKAFVAGETAIGDPITKISIPAADLKPTVVVEGTGASALRAGAGHYPNTPLPGQEGNVGIAGHRDTFFRPLRNIQADDIITLTTQQGEYRYRVVSTKVVRPENVEVLSSDGGEVLTLVTCYPFYYLGSAPDRFIVRASRVT